MLTSEPHVDEQGCSPPAKLRLHLYLVDVLLENFGALKIALYFCRYLSSTNTSIRFSFSPPSVIVLPGLSINPATGRWYEYGAVGPELSSDTNGAIVVVLRNREGAMLMLQDDMLMLS